MVCYLSKFKTKWQCGGYKWIWIPNHLNLSLCSSQIAWHPCSAEEMMWARREVVASAVWCTVQVQDRGISQSLSSGIHWIFSSFIGCRIAQRTPPWSLVHLAYTVVLWLVATDRALLVQDASGPICTSWWSTGYLHSWPICFLEHAKLARVHFAV